MPFPFLAAALIGSAVVGGVASAASAKKQSDAISDANERNAQLSQAQMDFQERMSGSAYQRAVTDMESAGLNPMLAYSQGGASTPSGATAVMQPAGQSTLGAGLSGASAAMSKALELDNLMQSTKESAAQESLLQAQVPKSLADARMNNASAEQVEIQNNINKKFIFEMERAKGRELGLKYEKDRFEGSQYLKKNTEQQHWYDLAKGLVEMEFKSLDQRYRQAEYTNPFITRQESAAAQAGEARLAKEKAEEAFYKSLGPGNKYLGMIGEFISGAKDARDIFRGRPGGAFRR